MKEKKKDIKVNLRALEPADIDLLYAWENDQSIWEISNTRSPFSRHILQKYIENSHLDIYQYKQLRLMIDVQRVNSSISTVGAIDIFDFDPFHLRAGVGILIYGTRNKNQGIATLALDELIKYAFSVLELHQLYCNISSDNQISMKLFQDAGFKIVGVKKEWLKRKNVFMDEVLLQLITRKVMIDS